MVPLGIGIEDPRLMAVQRFQHADVRVHHEVAAFGGADQAADCTSQKARLQVARIFNDLFTIQAQGFLNLSAF